jgi:hypothetical protein
VTAAHNVSKLAQAGPPVYVPNVRRPLTPVFDSVTGGDRQIALAWRTSGETNLQERRVYRAASESAAADVRDMDKVATLLPAATNWKDAAVPAGRTFFYRITAVNMDGLESLAAPPVAARAYDDSAPAPPSWSAPQADPQKLHVVLSWSAAAGLRYLVQRRLVSDPVWTSLTGWLKAGVSTSRDDDRGPGKQYVYRLLVRDQAERQNRSFNELTF